MLCGSKATDELQCKLTAVIRHRKACAIRSVPCSVAADDVEADHGDDIVLICRNMNAATI